MPDAPTIKPRFDLGGTLSRAFGVIGRHLPAFALLCLVTPAINVTIQHLLQPLLAGAMHPVLSTFILSVLSFVIHSAQLGALTYITVSDLNGRDAGLGSAVLVGLTLLPSLAAIYLLSFGGIMLGCILLVVPGILLTLRWLLVIPVRIAEDAGIGQAFRRSAALTKGYRWPLFVLLLGYVVLALLVNLALYLAAGSLAEIAARAATLDPAIIAIQVVGAGIASGIAAAVAAAAYLELRRLKEGEAPGRLAAVFE